MIRQFIYFYMILFNSVFLPGHAYKCDLPYGCRSERVFDSTYMVNSDTIMCDVNNDAFEFKFKPRTHEEIISNGFCNSPHSVIFRWTGSTGLNVLDKRFNFANAARYFAYFVGYMVAKFWNVKAIDVDIFDNNLFSDPYKASPFDSIELANSRLDFYHNKRKLNSCQDFIDLNLTQIRSIFQIQNSRIYAELSLINLKNNRPICPLVFTGSMIEYLQLIDFADTFYKTNILQFTNETFTDLNSTINRLYMHQVRNINLDLNLLNPSVFENIKMISIVSGSLKSIDGTIFKTFKRLTTIEMEQSIFRKINHKQGIKWIKEINQDVNFDFYRGNATNIEKLIKDIVLFNNFNKPILSISKIFPDQDFCLYIDFPFNQLVIILYNKWSYTDTYTDTNKLSCTFFWLVQYYRIYNNLIVHTYFSPLTLEQEQLINLIRSSSNDFESSMWKCDFEKRVNLCAKSNYQVRDIWDESDFFILNKRAETYLKASIYPISFLGMISIFIIIISILKKENVFEYKHYSYLILISIFSIMILQIYLLSWMTECFYPYHVFCPEMRKLVGIQFFKIIFKECLVSALRFMCSFTYIAFTLNRIGLIGNERGMMVSFYSKLAIKKYIALTFFISCIFSWIKGFKYQVNYFEYSDDNFPIWNDMKGEFQDFYFIFNFICDLANYFVLFMICLELDLALENAS